MEVFNSIATGLGSVILLEGSVSDRHWPIPDSSVQCVVTSPPYYGLRRYGTAPQTWGDTAVWTGELGHESSVDEYVAHLVSAFREVKRVLREDGVMFLNLGDSHAGSGRGPQGASGVGDSTARQGWDAASHPPSSVPAGYKAKDLMLIPSRVALALLADGWYLRADIIWAKASCMPESVRDRATHSHEHIFMFAKSASYYYDALAVYEPLAESSAERYRHNFGGKKTAALAASGDKRTALLGTRSEPAGRNQRDVWWLSPAGETNAARADCEAVGVEHFATFPPELPRRAILASTSERGCCPECGKPWRRVTDRVGGNTTNSEATAALMTRSGMGASTANLYTTRERGALVSVGWQPGCACDAGDPINCVVLDPFVGSGTTAAVAMELGRSFIGIDLNPKYLELTARRMARTLAAMSATPMQPPLT